MLKELDQQTMEETTGGTFCLIGGLLWSIFNPICQPKPSPCQPAPSPCEPKPAPSPCPTPTPTPTPRPS